jgi:hypothetical protein
MKDWATPKSRLIMFSDPVSSFKTKWKSLVEAYPGVFEYCGAVNRIRHIDQTDVSWGKLDDMHVFIHPSIGNLGQDTEDYIYDTVTGAIILNYMDKETTERLLPQIEEFLDSGARQTELEWVHEL